MNLLNIHYKYAWTGCQTRSHDPTAEIEWIGHLPRDLIIEILSHLPAKDLCKFRCVSKSWLDLLSSDEEFVSRHLHRSKQNPMSLTRRYLRDGITENNNMKSEITIELTSRDVQGNIADKFAKKIDGPVHTFATCGPLSIFCTVHSLYMCNPSMRRVVWVPSDPNARLHDVSFGYLPKKNEYKIVHMFYTSSGGGEKMGCEIFSFTNGENVKSGSWRKIGDRPISAWAEGHPVCASGVMYWSYFSVWEKKIILCLDLENEEFDNICYPACEDRKYSFSECVGLMGGLRVVGFSAEEPKTIDIWALKDKKTKVWGLECKINPFPMCPKFLIPTCDGESKEILVHMSDKDLIAYDVRSGTWRRVEYYKAMKTYNKPSLYYDSLVPL